MEFPFLKLPFLAIEEVLSNAEFSDLIHFSFASKRSQRRVKLLRKPANIELCIFVDELGISIETSKKPEIGWKILYEVEKRERPITKVIAGFEMSTLSLGGFLFTYENWELKKCALIAINYLKDLFRCSVDFIELWPDLIPHSNSSSLNLPIKCQTMYIEGGYALSYDKFWEILEDTEIDECVTIDIQITGNPRTNVERWRRCNKIDSEASEWITKEMICNMKFWFILLKNTSLSPEDCGYIINQWFNSRNNTLYLLKLEDVIPGPDGLTFENLGLKMPYLPYDGKRRKKDFLLNDYKTADLSNAMDILRGDGIFASIMICTREVYFGVWRNPIVDNNGKIVFKDPTTMNNF